MPLTFSRKNVRKIAFRTRGRAAQSLDVSEPGLSNTDPGASGDGPLFLQIRPAFADSRAALVRQRSHTVLRHNYNSKQDGRDDVLDLQAVGTGKVQLARTPQEKDRLPDRITLDRRGLSSIPHIVGEPGLRLLSLQHNLINSLSGLSPLDLSKLVFLDVYDNQIDKISSLERLFSLRVLLMGKNRIKRIEGLANLIKLEVLDLHGNRITKVGGLSNVNELKVLNLAGNQIKVLGPADLHGLVSLRELNLKRNRIRKLTGFLHTPKLHKLYLGNNDLQSVEDMSSLAEATCLVDVSLDGNPVALGGDCTPFLVSYLPNLVTLTNMHITEQVRTSAMAWRSNKEAAHAAFFALGGMTEQSARRDQIIHNARTNWELLRSEHKCFTLTSTNTGPSKSSSTESELTPVPTTATILTHSGGTQTEIAALPDVVLSLHEIEKEKSVSRNNYSCEITKTSIRKPFQRSSTAKLSEKRVNFSERSASQDTDASHSTSTSSDLRLPPILIPIITSLENVKLSDDTEPILRRWESISSVEPVVDSSFGSLISSSSDSEGETCKKRTFRRVPTALRRQENFSFVRSKSVCDPESRRTKTNAKKSDNSENASNISLSTNIGSIVSTSGSEHVSKISKKENRNSRSATTARRNERAGSANRASTARGVKSGKSLASFKSSEPVPKPMSTSKDREQGVDYLVEVNEGVVSAWGAGAVRRLTRDWDWEQARNVTRAAFHYVHFNAVVQSLTELKNKFPNVTHISLRAVGLQSLGQLHAFAELRGITALTILPEGNPIHDKIWREYAIYRLTHWGLKEINGELVSEEEIKLANETYTGLTDLVLRALPDAPLQPLLSRLGQHTSLATSAKVWLRTTDPALREVIAKEALQYKKGVISQDDMKWRTRGLDQLSQAIELACEAAKSLRLLELEWPSILVEIIEDILKDYSQMDTHVKEQIQMLMESM